jgi:hypothetical protein
VQRLEHVAHVMFGSVFVVSVPAIRFASPHHTSAYAIRAAGGAVGTSTVGEGVGKVGASVAAVGVDGTPLSALTAPAPLGSVRGWAWGQQ